MKNIKKMKKTFIMATAAITLMMTMTILTSCTDSDDILLTSPEQEQEQENLADYTIIFYGHGGGNLDMDILANVMQLYQGKAESYDRVNIVAQYKFSSEENMLVKFSAADAQYFGSQSIRFVVERDADKTYNNFDDCYTDDMLYGEKNADFTCPDSLTRFINWAAKRCPAKHYLLILSDHGGGYVPYEELPKEDLTDTRGIIYDDGNNYKNFTVKSLHRALSNADVHMQTIYMDACLMNTIEYQYELKDVADYLVLSTFLVPGYGGHYDFLIDQLAAHHDDTEKALSEYNRQAVSYWDDEYSQYTNYFNYHDMSVIRTAALEAFGQKWKLFTDKLIAAYQSGDETVKQKINQATAIVPRVNNDTPLFDIGDYYLSIYKLAPEVIDDAFYAELDAAYKNTVVSKHNSDFLENYGMIIDCSILICKQGHYNVCDIIELSNGDKMFSYLYTYYADGSLYELDTQTQEMKPSGTWGGTLENTYQQLAFDRATGWSRWLMINEQEPPYASYADFHIDLPSVLNLK